MNNLNIEKVYYFPTAIYTLKNTTFLPKVREISKEYMDVANPDKTLNEIYPLFMSSNYFLDARLKEFTDFVGHTAWNILQDQGYNMDNKTTFFTEMWTQEHYKTSNMEKHFHKFGSQIVGFYFLDVPKNSSKIILHDPRETKSIIGLHEKDTSKISDATETINLTPEEGLFVFTNSWLSHSFNRNESDKPFRFVHFNLSVMDIIPQPIHVPPPAEVI